jgi:hypothetical protein
LIKKLNFFNKKLVKDKLVMGQKKLIDYYQLQLMFQEFYQERKLNKYPLEVLIHVLLQMMKKLIVGDIIRIFYYFFFIFYY